VRDKRIAGVRIWAYFYPIRYSGLACGVNARRAYLQLGPLILSALWD
jgi:hypothetical protein